MTTFTLALFLLALPPAPAVGERPPTAAIGPAVPADDPLVPWRMTDAAGVVWTDHSLARLAWWVAERDRAIEAARAKAAAKTVPPKRPPFLL